MSRNIDPMSPHPAASALTLPNQNMDPGMRLDVDAALDKLQRDTFGYFLRGINPANGLVINKTAPAWPASIAATDLALAGYPVSVKRGFMKRAAAVEQQTLSTLRFFWNGSQGTKADAAEYQGFCLHFFDP